MLYRAVLNVDYATPLDGNEYEKLKNALVQTGWAWVETSAFTIETRDIDEIWQGIGLVARQTRDVGDVTALTFHVQGSETFDGMLPRSAPNHPYATADILAKPFPGLP